jgi:hypothetical protein
MLNLSGNKPSFMKTPIQLLFFVFASTFTFGQGLTPPSEGKSVVYFTRLSAAGFAIGFEFFHDKQYIGDFAGRNYMRYECDPGEQLFWASSENKAFLTASLEPGATYVVIVDVLMGIGIARVGLRPINSQDKLLEKAKKLINKKEPVFTSPEEIESRNKRLAEFIEKKLKQYHEDWKNTKNFKHLSADMAIPPSVF